MAPPHPAGRWPSNLVLVHGPGCRQDGTKKFKSGTAVRGKGVSNAVAYGGNIGRLPKGTPDLGYVSEDGLETVTAWACELGCLVAQLDEQSGRISSHGGGISHGLGYQGGDADRSIPKGGSGGASRFFPQFASEAELDEWFRRLIFGPGEV